MSSEYHYQAEGFTEALPEELAYQLTEDMTAGDERIVEVQVIRIVEVRKMHVTVTNENDIENQRVWCWLK